MTLPLPHSPAASPVYADAQRQADVPVWSPLTGDRRVTRIRTLETAPLIADWAATYRIDIRDELHDLDRIDVYRCDATGLVFFRPTSVAGSPTLYRRLQTATAYYAALKWEHLTALRDLRGVRTVLEIGCGAGAFVRRAREAGLDARGVDVNPDAVAEARRAGLPVELPGPGGFATIPGTGFDAVCAFQVLEHLAEPGEFLASAVRLLRPGGTLILSVPNADGFLKHYHEILDLPPHHMSQWSRATFEALPTRFGIRLLACRAEPLAADHVTVYVNAQAQRLRSSGTPGRLVANRYSRRAAAALLRSGARRIVNGHTLYARFVKTG